MNKQLKKKLKELQKPYSIIEEFQRRGLQIHKQHGAGDETIYSIVPAEQNLIFIEVPIKLLDIKDMKLFGDRDFLLLFEDKLYQIYTLGFAKMDEWEQTDIYLMDISKVYFNNDVVIARDDKQGILFGNRPDRFPFCWALDIFKYKGAC